MTGHGHLVQDGQRPHRAGSTSPSIDAALVPGDLFPPAGPELAGPLGLWAAIVGLIALLALASIASAHDLSKTTVSATFGDGRFEIVMRTDAQLLLMQLQKAAHSERAEADFTQPRSAGEWRELILGRSNVLLDAAAIRFDGVRVRPRMGLSIASTSQPVSSPGAVVHLTGTLPQGATRFEWSYALLYGPYALTVRRGPHGAIATEWLSGPQTSQGFPLGTDVGPVGTATAAARYLALGYTHILPGGLDHILFVCALCLLSRRLRPLLSQVSAFTVAHSVTLGLSMYGVISAPAAFVEPLIAASIAFVAIENVFTSDLKPWRIVLVFAFGLLHGLGFAGALAQLGLPRSEFLTALVSFNVGVEAGQMSVVAVAVGTLLLFTRLFAWDPRRLVAPVSAMIAATGVYWTIARVVG